MNRNPITTGTAIDFVGEEYEVESLPDVAGCNEGDRCEICWPGGSGWYQTAYIVQGGRWVEEWSTAPWQMSA
jgi:hypothetical protein